MLRTSYKGGGSRLNIDQEAALKGHILLNTYSSSDAIIEYVKQTYNTNFSNSGMVHLLERLGFVYKKTKLVPGKADAKKQEEFLQEYHELKEQMNTNDELLFMDGTHPRHNLISSYAWILKGKEKKFLPIQAGIASISMGR